MKTAHLAASIVLSAWLSSSLGPGSLVWEQGQSLFERAGTRPVGRYVLKPVDEALTDGSLAAFRERLRNDISRRDRVAMLSAFGPNFDRAAYDHYSSRLREADYELWDDLERALSLGGAFTSTRGSKRGRREFCAPYVYAAYPQQMPRTMAAEMYTYGDPWAIVHENAPAYERPDPASRVLARLSYELVRAQGDVSSDSGDTWIWIYLSNGRSALVRPTDIESPERFHVCLAHENNRWSVSAIDWHVRPE